MGENQAVEKAGALVHALRMAQDADCPTRQPRTCPRRWMRLPSQIAADQSMQLISSALMLARRRLSRAGGDWSAETIFAA
jgi:hypothetical protein